MAPGMILAKVDQLPDGDAIGQDLRAALDARLNVTAIQPWLNRAMIDAAMRQSSTRYRVIGSRNGASLAGLRRIYVIEYTRPLRPEVAAALVTRLRGIDYAEPVFLPHLMYSTDDEYLAQQWYLDRIGAPTAWEHVRADSTMIVAIVDTGIDKLHPDLASAIWNNPGETGSDAHGNDKRTNGIDDDGNGLVDDWWGYDFAGSDGHSPDNDPSMAGESHGTEIAGIVGATGNNGIGIAGVAWGVRLMAVKGAEDGRDPALPGGFDGILYAATMGARVINCSWGGGAYSRAQQEVIDVVTNQYDAVVVAAAGNDGERSFVYPASYRGVLSVASVDNGDTKSDFSNYNSRVGISAPGRDIYTTAAFNGYAFEQGTSHATGVASGGAALVRAAFPNLSAAQTREVLRATSDDISSINSAYADGMGDGRLNVARAVTTGSSIASARVTDYRVVDANSDGVLDPGEHVRVELDVTNLLAASDAVVVEMIPESDPGLVIDGPSVTMNSMATGETRTTSDGTFEFTLPSNLDPDATLRFRVNVYTDDHQTTTMIELRANPTWLSTDHNDITATFNSIGNIAFNGIGNGQGDGFLWNGGRNFLFHGGLIIATDSAHLSDVVRVGSISSGTAHGFELVAPYRLHMDSAANLQVGSARFDDLHQPADRRVGVEVAMHTYEFKALGADNSVIAEYTIKNVSGARIEGLHCGLYLDWDVGVDGAGDQASFDSQTAIGYVHNVDETQPVVGAALLTPQPLSYTPLDQYDPRYDITVGFTPEEKWAILSGGISTDQPPVSDASMIIGASGISLEGGDSVRVAFVLAAASDLDSLRATIVNDRVWYQPLTGIEPQTHAVRRQLLSSHVWPNPFAQSFTIEFRTASAATVRLDIYDPNGRRALPTRRMHLPAGGHSIAVDGSDLADGAYLYRIAGPDFTIDGKVSKVTGSR